MLSFHQVAELQDLQQDLPAFQQRLQELLTRLDLSLINYHADHVSVRCFQQATAERWRSGFMQCATLISEKEINGRPICLFSLHEPLQVGEWDIDCVELPYPGSKLYPHEGWEHVEWVVPCANEDDFHQTALGLFSDEVLLMPQLKLKFNNPAGEGERLPNPTLAVTDNGVTIKLHPYSIRDVVDSEKDDAVK